ncbi:transketolase [bacterium]|nr:transketolase [bacterium]
MDKKEALKKIADRLRIHTLKMTTKAGSGHPSTCLSMAELAACLFFGEMQYDVENPLDWSNDEFVLSKGHAAPILWAVYAEAGIISQKSLMRLRQINSSLEGHPTPRMKWVKAATGSLGQGLSVGAGMALSMKVGKISRRVYVVMGDGECAEGSVWEAVNTAAHLGLDNLLAVVDINRLGQSEATMHGHDVDAYEKKFRAFGWKTIPIDGHNIDEILRGFEEARKANKPSVILAKTVKGKGVSILEDQNGWHGKPLKKEKDYQQALQELGPMPEIQAQKYVKRPSKIKHPLWKRRFRFQRNSYTEKTPTRRAYGNALVNLAEVNDAVVTLDGDVKNSTYAKFFFSQYPNRAFQVYIAEQNMIGMGLGLASRGYIPFMATFSAFLSRAHDQIRMAAYSFSNLKIVGSHSGVSIGEDGPSQMGLEDMAIFTPIPGCAVLYPCDAYSAEGCVESMARYKGMAYLRTTRPGTPLLYNKKEKFPIGGCKVVKKRAQDEAVVISAGICVFEALKACEELKEEGTAVRVIDAYSVKPLDENTIAAEVEEAGRKVVVVEDHYPSGGLGKAVSSALAGKAHVAPLAVKELPRSGKPVQLLDKYGISAAHIKESIRNLLKK